MRCLEVIFDRLKALGIAVKADMGDASRGHQRQHAVEETDPGAQDRCKRQFLAGDFRGLHRHQRRFDIDDLQRQIAGHLIAEQHADLVQKLPKALGGPVGLAHQRQLVLDEGMADEMNVAGGSHALSWRQ